MYRGHSAGHVGTAGRSRFTLQLLYVKDKQDGDGFFFFFFFYTLENDTIMQKVHKGCTETAQTASTTWFWTPRHVTIKKGHQL